MENFDLHVRDCEDTEKWHSIPGFEGLYEASSLGRIRSLDRVVPTKHGQTKRFKGRVLKQQYRANTGYLMVALSKHGQPKDYYVHRLVLAAFYGYPAEPLEACHGNDIRTDNRLDNLRWDTHHANVHDAIRRNRMRNHNREKTHCARGHKFDETNTFIRREGRSCKECRRLTARIRYQKTNKF